MKWKQESYFKKSQQTYGSGKKKGLIQTSEAHPTLINHRRQRFLMTGFHGVLPDAGLPTTRSREGNVALHLRL